MSSSAPSRFEDARREGKRRTERAVWTGAQVKEHASGMVDVCRLKRERVVGRASAERRKREEDEEGRKGTEVSVRFSLSLSSSKGGGWSVPMGERARETSKRSDDEETMLKKRERA